MSIKRNLLVVSALAGAMLVSGSAFADVCSGHHLVVTTSNGGAITKNNHGGDLTVSGFSDCTSGTCKPALSLHNVGSASAAQCVAGASSNEITVSWITKAGLKQTGTIDLDAFGKSNPQVHMEKLNATTGKYAPKYDLRIQVGYPVDLTPDSREVAEGKVSGTGLVFYANPVE